MALTLLSTESTQYHRCGPVPVAVTQKPIQRPASPVCHETPDIMNQRNSLQLLTLLVAVSALLVASACSQTAESAAAEQEVVELLPMPQPNLEQTTPAVARQIRERQLWQFRIDSASASTAQQKGAAMGELGALYHAYQMEGEAVVCYRNAEALDPDAFRWPYYLCQALGRTNQPEEALKACRRAAELNNQDAAVRVRLAELLNFLGRSEEAKPFFQQALEMDPSTAAAHSGLGLILIASDPAAAASHFEKALELQPDALAAHTRAAAAHRASGNEARAAAHEAKAGEGEVKLAEPLMAAIQGLSVGQQLYRQKAQRAIDAEKFDEAEENFRRAVAADPLFADLRVALAAILVQNNKPGEALEQYQLALDLSPKHPRASFGAAFLLQRSGRDQEAIPYYRVALETTPGHRPSRTNLAQALFETEQYDEALGELTLLVAEEPNDISMRLVEVGTLIKMDRFREALGRLEAGVTELEGHAALKQTLARFLATVRDDELRDGERAMLLADELFKAEEAPENAETLAMALAAAGRFDEAVQVQQVLLATAQEAGRENLVQAVTQNLERFRRGETALPPWEVKRDSPAGPGPRAHGGADGGPAR